MGADYGKLPTNNNLYPNEPNAKLYWNDNKDGSVYTISNNIKDFGGKWNNDVRSADLPPHVKITFYSDQDYKGDKWSYQGNKTDYHTTPGYIPKMSSTPFGKNNNESAKISKGRGWKNYIIDCCLNPTAKKNTCSGRWFGGGSYYGAGNAPPCDSLIKAYCKMPEHKDDPKCACLNSSIDHPLCFDAKCMKSGYYTKAMRDKGCNITQINCNQIIDAETQGKVILDRAKVTQYCGNIDSGSPQPTFPTPPTTWRPPSQQKTQPSFLKKNMNIILLFVVAFFIIILGLVGMDIMISGGGDSFDLNPVLLY